MRKLYIADPHFGHEAIIKMCQRPFQSIEEMDRVMIHNWNQAVGDHDEVYVLGDFMFRTKRPPEYYLDQLKGKKHLIIGNHDGWRKKVDISYYFESASQIKKITDESRHIVLCHFPMVEWPRYYKGSLHIFGHIHNARGTHAFRFYQSSPNMFNAGVDINHFIPVTLNQLIANNAAFRRHNENNGM